MGESSGDGEGEDGAVAGRIDGDKGVVGDDGADDDDVDDDIGDDDKIDGGDEERSIQKRKHHINQSLQVNIPALISHTAFNFIKRKKQIHQERMERNISYQLPCIKIYKLIC